MSCYINSENLDAKTDEWLEKIKVYNVHPLKPQKGKTALMVVDMQNFFLDPASPTYVEAGNVVMQNVRALLYAFRKAKAPVIFTRHVHHPAKIDAGIMGWWWDGMCLEGTPASEIRYELKPLPDEKVVLKHRYSAFYNTDLETILRCQGVEDIVMTGVMTNMCCESTTRDAYFRDYIVHFIADATGAKNEQMHMASLLNLSYGFANVTKTRNILEAIDK